MLLANSLYRVLACRIGRGDDLALFRPPFRDFIDAIAAVTITETEAQMRHLRRTNYTSSSQPDLSRPTDASIPWVGGHRRQLLFRWL